MPRNVDQEVGLDDVELLDVYVEGNPNKPFKNRKAGKNAWDRRHTNGIEEAGAMFLCGMRIFVVKPRLLWWMINGRRDAA